MSSPMRGGVLGPVVVSLYTGDVSTSGGVLLGRVGDGFTVGALDPEGTGLLTIGTPDDGTTTGECDELTEGNLTVEGIVGDRFG
jgi:hypothetical protein